MPAFPALAAGVVPAGEAQVLAWTATPAQAVASCGGRLEVEEELDSARHRDAITQRRPKSPVAGCLNRGAVETRFHAMGKGHACDVPVRIDFDIHRDVTASATVSRAQGVGGLLLFQHCRRLNPGGEAVLPHRVREPRVGPWPGHNGQTPSATRAGANLRSKANANVCVEQESSSRKSDSGELRGSRNPHARADRTSTLDAKSDVQRQRDVPGISIGSSDNPRSLP